MKKFIYTLYGEEIKEFKAFTRKQKAVFIYLETSLIIAFLLVCSNSFTAMTLAFINLIVALYKGAKHLPNFGKEE